MENKRLSDGTYPIMQNGSICIGTLTGSTCSDTLVVEVAGETPESGTVTIKSRKIDSYEFTYKSGFVVINGEINDGGIVELAPGLYDENNNLIYTWEELLTEQTLEGITAPILSIDENGVLFLDEENGGLMMRSTYIKGKLVIDDSVTMIDSSAFENCEGLTSVIIPDTVTSIGDMAFGETGLVSVIIGSGVTSIGDHAFYGCTDLTSVTIGKKLTRIADYAFYRCESLSTINYFGTKEEWDSIYKGEYWNVDENGEIITIGINYEYKI